MHTPPHVTTLATRAMALLLASALLAGCNDENSAPPEPVEGEVEIDASSNTAFTYFNLLTGEVVTPANPASSTEWHLAFRRYTVRVNSGTAGSGDVRGYNLENNVAATTDQVLAFTPDNQRPFFDGIGTTDIPAASAFSAEGLAPDFSSWFSPTSAGLNANPLAVWKLRRSTGAGAGAYALIRVSAIGNGTSPSRMNSITLQYRLQLVPGTLGAMQAATLDLPPGTTEAGLNLSTGAQVAPTPGDCAWDVSVTEAYTLSVNAGCSAGTFPLDVSESFDALTSAADAPEYGPFMAQVSGPVPSTFDDPAGPFLYDLAGDRRLSPTFNVYLVRVGSTTYKVQLTRYYSVAGGASGFPTLRYAEIQ